MVIHIDTREPADLRGTKHKNVNGKIGLIEKVLGSDQVIIRKLDSADYAFFDQDCHSLGLERKAGADFTASMGAKSRQANGNYRLYNQLDKMKLDFTHRGLILEGKFGFDPITKNWT